MATQKKEKIGSFLSLGVIGLAVLLFLISLIMIILSALGIVII